MHFNRKAVRVKASLRMSSAEKQLANNAKSCFVSFFLWIFAYFIDFTYTRGIANIIEVKSVRPTVPDTLVQNVYMYICMCVYILANGSVFNGGATVHYVEQMTCVQAICKGLSAGWIAKTLRAKPFEILSLCTYCTHTHMCVCVH